MLIINFPLVCFWLSMCKHKVQPNNNNKKKVKIVQSYNNNNNNNNNHRAKKKFLFNKLCCARANVLVTFTKQTSSKPKSTMKINEKDKNISVFAINIQMLMQQSIQKINVFYKEIVSQKNKVKAFFYVICTQRLCYKTYRTKNVP